MQQQTVPRQTNGSYGRLTNKLNCCRSCVRDSDDAQVKNAKLKNDTKYPSHFIDSNHYYEQAKCKLPSEVRRSSISDALRRNSMDANTLRKSMGKHSVDEELLNGVDFRRQSFDDNGRLLKKLTPPQLEYQSDLHRNGNGHGLSQSFGKHVTSNDIQRVVKQKSLDEYNDATARLRKLEMKMRKHKVDVLKYANDHDQSNIFSEPKKSLAYPPPNHFRTKLDTFARAKADCVYPKIGIDSVVRSKNPPLRKAHSNGSYGIITASELYKLRATPERVT